MPRTLRRSTSRNTDTHAKADAVHEEAPARGRRRGSEDKPAGPKVSSGWGGYEKVKSESGDYAEDFKPDNDEVLIHFLDEEPFAVFRQHWIERKGKKSFTCLEEDCPLCDDLGDRPGAKIAFNVVNLRDPDAPVVERWLVGTKVANVIKEYAGDKKTSPINRDDLYWAVKRTGKQGSYQTNLTPVKERDLADDWDVEPLTADDLEGFDAEAYGGDSIEQQTRKQLQEIADEALGDD